jgi:hypothetical protein
MTGEDSGDENLTKTDKKGSSAPNDPLYGAGLASMARDSFRKVDRHGRFFPNSLRQRVSLGKWLSL